jgi:hypothetical protein
MSLCLAWQGHAGAGSSLPAGAHRRHGLTAGAQQRHGPEQVCGAPPAAPAGAFSAGMALEAIVRKVLTTG